MLLEFILFNLISLSLPREKTPRHNSRATLCAHLLQLRPPQGETLLPSGAGSCGKRSRQHPHPHRQRAEHKGVSRRRHPH